jgi:Sulfotransferase domain
MDSPSPPVPRFVVIGAQKSATRWLRQNLGEHPDIFTPSSELHFWNVEFRVRKLGLDWYREQFDGWDGEPIVGEATPGYMIWRHDPATVAARMKELCPDIRLIAMLRNPIDRANSAMVHHIRKGRLPADSRLVDVVRARTPPEKDRLGLVAGGWYAASLEPFLDAFGERLLLLWHDDIATDPVGVYEAALRHIGASPDFRPTELSKVIFSNRNRNPKAGPFYELTHDDRLEMWEYFRDDVARLEQMLDVDLSRWEPRRTGKDRGRAASIAGARSRWWARGRSAP